MDMKDCKKAVESVKNGTPRYRIVLKQDIDKAGQEVHN